MSIGKFSPAQLEARLKSLADRWHGADPETKVQLRTEMRQLVADTRDEVQRDQAILEKALSTYQGQIKDTRAEYAEKLGAAQDANRARLGFLLAVVPNLLAKRSLYAERDTTLATLYRDTKAMVLAGEAELNEEKEFEEGALAVVRRHVDPEGAKQADEIRAWFAGQRKAHLQAMATSGSPLDYALFGDDV